MARRNQIDKTRLHVVAHYDALPEDVRKLVQEHHIWYRMQAIAAVQGVSPEHFAADVRNKNPMLFLAYAKMIEKENKKLGVVL